MDISKLNEEQKEAVTTTNGPLLVIAGAGSGKTKVLTNRIAYLLEKGVSPFSILAITFTNKAAKEMKDRVISLVGDIGNNMQISTFHSFGVKVLRRNYSYLNLTSTFNIYDSEDSLTLIKRIYKELNIDEKIINPKNVKNKISSLKNDMISPDSFSKYAKDRENEIILDVYKKYQKELISNNAVDFDDLLVLPVKLFRENKEILDYYQEKYKYILIDEYQDTNEAQYKLTKYIASKYQNICVVGDSDQTIYGFRGANYKNILNFNKDYPLCKTVVLNKNYRSTQNILDVANSIIKNNKSRYVKDLISVSGEGTKVVWLKSKDNIEELNFIGNKIKELKKDYDYNDMVILYRTNAQSRILEEYCNKNLIPYRIYGSLNFFSRKEIKDIMAYLKVINNPNDSVSLIRAIKNPKKGIGDKSIEKLLNISEEKGISLYDAIYEGKSLEFKKYLNNLRDKVQKLSFVELIDELLETSGLIEELEKEDSVEAESRIENLEEFKSIAASYQSEYGVLDLNDFLADISLQSEQDRDIQEEDRITLMTIHCAKGLEYDNVFITGLENEVFPHKMSIDEGNIEEERRLMYVAVTRAKKNLFLLSCKNRLLYGKTNENSMESTFVKEIDEDLLEKIDHAGVFGEVKQKKILNKDDYYKEDNEEYHVGDNVFHDVFGIGKVLEVEKSVMKVAFKLPYGIKQLMKNHKSVRKV